MPRIGEDSKASLLKVNAALKEWIRQYESCQHDRAPAIRDGDFMVTLCAKCHIVICAEEV